MSVKGMVRGLVFALMCSVFVPTFAYAAVGVPEDLTIVGGKYTNDNTPRFIWDPAEGATWYAYSLDGSSFEGIGNVLSYTLDELEDGWHTFSLKAHSGSSTSSTRSVTFEIDTEGPTVPAVSPSTATEDQKVTFVVKPYGESDPRWCDLYVNGKNVGDMIEVSDDRFEFDYTFANSGSYSVYAHCTDGDMNSTKGASRTVKVTEGDETPTGIQEGDLIKTACSTSLSSDPCRAVYYYGEDGKRHAFPNENIFYTWFDSFDDVEIVSSSFMSSLMLGKNVTYRPGSALIQFSSSDTVYAVSEGGVLHKYLSTSLIKGDWGSNWANYLEIIPDSLFTSFTVGSVIDSSGDYDPDEAWDSVESIDDNF